MFGKIFSSASVVLVAGLVASSMAITITSPNGNDFWVQNTSKTITWTFDNGDSNPIDISVINTNQSFLNGAFSIQRNVDLSNGSFTITNVTLRVGTGYEVIFVKPTNQSDVLATSSQFEVKPPGTAAANVSTTGTSSGSQSTATAPSGSGTGTASGSTQTGGTNDNSGAVGLKPLTMSGVLALVGVVMVL